jgi:hypothetical protein
VKRLHHFNLKKQFWLEKTVSSAGVSLEGPSPQGALSCCGECMGDSAGSEWPIISHKPPHKRTFTYSLPFVTDIFPGFRVRFSVIPLRGMTEKRSYTSNHHIFIMLSVSQSYLWEVWLKNRTLNPGNISVTKGREWVDVRLWGGVWLIMGRFDPAESSIHSLQHNNAPWGEGPSKLTPSPYTVFPVKTIF